MLEIMYPHQAEEKERKGHMKIIYLQGQGRIRKSRPIGELMSKHTQSKIRYCVRKRQEHMTSKTFKPRNRDLIVFDKR